MNDFLKEFRKKVNESCLAEGSLKNRGAGFR